MTDRDAAMRVAAGLLLASGFRHIEDSNMRAARANVLRRVDTVRSGWRRRSGNVVGAVTIGVGGFLVLQQYRAARREAATRPVDRADGSPEMPSIVVDVPIHDTLAAS